MAMHHNKKMVLQKVDHFIRLRRFETMSLHEVIQDLKVSWIIQKYFDIGLRVLNRLLRYHGCNHRNCETTRQARRI